ncbi:MAG: hypothetical protein WAK26_06120, partial [Terracidiphilus sp.]
GMIRKSKVWVMDFEFHGQRIRESTEQTSKTLAKEVYDKRIQSLKAGTAGIRTQKHPNLLSTAAEKWKQAKQAKWPRPCFRLRRTAWVTCCL